MRWCGMLVVLLLSTGCATTRVVHLDTGRATPLVYRPIESEPVRVGDDEFKESVTQLVLDMRLNVGRGLTGPDDCRSLLASSGGVVDGAQGSAMLPASERMCQQSGASGCITLLAGGVESGPLARSLIALFFAFDTVWPSVEGAIGSLADPAALRAMVVSMVGTTLVMLVAPEPITKLIAIGLTASLIAYLGTGPVWNLGQGFLRLMQDSRGARDLAGLKTVGHRYGKVLGDNGARVLVIVALAALGGKNALAAQGPRLPGAAHAALRAQTEGGFLLPAAITGGVRSLSLPSAGVLNVTLAPTAVAAVAMGPGVIQGDLEGEIHHICTDKNEVSAASGGPWTPLFEKIFNRAGMKLSDPANQIRIQGHRGPHPLQYHAEVLRRLRLATEGCRGVAQCRDALVDILAEIAKDLTTAGSPLRTSITGAPKG